MLNRLSANTWRVDDPWCHWIADDFLTTECLQELKSVDHARPQQTQGKRLGQDRLFIDHSVKDLYPHLFGLWLDLHDGMLCEYFEHWTRTSFRGLWPRVEVISDIGDFYLDRHHDHLEKKLTALIYTDHARLWPGTQLSDDYVIPSQDNRCMFFVPAQDTWHSYPHTHFDVVRRALQINYWTYPAS